MPRMFVPPVPKAGPGSARGMAGSSRKRRGKRSKSPAATTTKKMESPPPATEDSSKARYIGQELVNSKLVLQKRSLSKRAPELSRPKHRDDEQKEPDSSAPLTTTSNTTRNRLEPEPISATTTSDFSRLKSITLASRALGLDTRFISGSPGSSALQQSICSHFEMLVETLSKRGCAPQRVASTCVENSSYRKKNQKEASKTVVSVKVDELYKKGEGKTITMPTIRAVPIESTSSSTSASHSTPGTSLSTGGELIIPRKLIAGYSWAIMGKMVESIIKKSHGSTKNHSPLAITLVTTDAAFFCDLDQQAHKTGATHFWQRVSDLFVDSTISSVHIYCSKTERVVAFSSSRDQEMGESNDISLDGTTEKCSTGPTGREHFEKESYACAQNIQKCFSDLCNENLQQQSQFLNPLKNNGSSKETPPINISFSLIEHSHVGYKHLSRCWAQEVLASRQRPCRLNVALPETMDGTQCTVSLDASYQIFPFSLDSHDTNRIINDLNKLSEDSIESMQLVPLSSLDASLIYGIPILVRTALQEDLEIFREMEALVCALFRTLQERELGLVLCTRPMENNHRGSLDKKTLTNLPSFHGNFAYHQRGLQVMILMAQETSSKTVFQGVPNTGILVRYAQADHFLAESGPSSSGDGRGGRSGAAGTLSGSSMDKVLEYSEFIESSLDALSCSAINPLDPEFLRTYDRGTMSSYHHIHSATITTASTTSSSQNLSQASTLTKSGTDHPIPTEKESNDDVVPQAPEASSYMSTSSSGGEMETSFDYDETE